MRLPGILHFLYRFDFMNNFMAFTRLDKVHLETEGELQCTATIDVMVAKLPDPDKEAIDRLPKSSPYAHHSLQDLATSTFDKVVGYEQIDLAKWRVDYQEDLGKLKKETHARLAERDKIERTKADSQDRLLPLTGNEKFEVVFLVFVAVLLWILGYLSMVELIKSLDTPLTTNAIYFLPAAGVTVLAFSIKMLLGMFKGGRIYKQMLMGCMVLAFLAGLGWLFYFSEFIQFSSQEVQFRSLDEVGDSEGKSGMAYVIMTVLAEALGAAAAWSWVNYLLHSKTIRSTGDNPEWLKLNEIVEALEKQCDEYERRIALCESLNAKIDAARKEYIARNLLIYQSI